MSHCQITKEKIILFNYSVDYGLGADPKHAEDIKPYIDREIILTKER
ncbi:hypothetical protein ACFLZ7_03885 [Nanoarchaeota archaeon]